MASDIQVIQPFVKYSSQWLLKISVGVFFFIAFLYSIDSNTSVNVVALCFVLWYLCTRFFPSNFTTAIFFALLYQWLQISIKVIYSTFEENPLSQMTDFPHHIQKAFFLSIFTIFILALGIQTQLKKINFSTNDILKYLEQYSTSKIFVIYIIFTITTPFIYLIGNIIPGIYQAITMLINFKWVLFIILFLSVFKKREMIIPFWFLVGFEFITSLFSFFASFKSIVFFLLIGFTSLAPITRKKMIWSLSVGVLIYYFAIFWTDIKGDYRSFLNRGTKSQSILVSQGEANAYLWKTITQYDFTNYKKAKNAFIDRISYIDYFSACINYVPSHLSHEKGAILKNSISHILMPRFLFPEKGRIDDSNHLNKYTGLSFSNYEKGVSFSLGYAGDFYIDFGENFMFIFIFLFGALIGYILLNIYKNSINILWGIGALTSSFEILYKFENSQIKFLGNLIWFWIVFFILNKFVIPHIHRYLLK